MIDPANVPPIAEDELLARFATQRGQFRAGERTVKPDLFTPHPRAELSVMRHRDASTAEIWRVGWATATVQGRTLYGRAEITAATCHIGGLFVIASPIFPDNPNHADIRGWPPKKEDKKSLAQKLAAAASKLISPPPISE
jgi:hypothetical protein